MGNTYISDQLDATESMATSGSAFDKALHKEYMWVARTEHASGEPASNVGALMFNKRSATAGSGQRVDPIDPASVAVDDPEIVDGYKRLTAAAAAGGADKAPADMAKAQAAFDCWVYAVCNRQSGIAEECKKRFLDAMAAVEAALAPAGPPMASNFIAYFDWDSSAIRPDAAQVLNEVLRAAGGMEGSKVFATGYTDTSGSPQYNLGLSERRAVSVRDYLINGGLGSYRIFIDWRGEADPRVPTGPNVREQENRRVEMRLQ
ncbi:MAG: OmpA family protein [Alphaproteobacteria bacterium]|nr:OmpA family protein [Alphaproteobacteria bacterium]